MTLQARYTILRKVADGGTAEIFLATQRGAHGFEKPVILKRIFPAFYADPQFRHMLVDEAHIAMSLNHSNIVQVLDLGEADGQYVLALELVDGWTLDAVLRRARALKTSIPPPLALYMTAEVCRALAYAHAKLGPAEKPLGIVHRDISPHNVLLSEQGEVKLTDFGIAQAHNRRESSVGTMIKGKIAYMSPEQASGTELDARSDLFSVGTMLYVMVCRRYPFDAPTDLEMLLLVKGGAFEAPEKAMPGLNPEIYRVIKRAMGKSPEERYQRAEEMLIDVEQVMRVAFRAVGQTELKRWLQDLSMRDGVPPLTRTAPPPSSASDGRLEGEILELKGVGTTTAPTLPPPTSHRPPAGTTRGGAPGKGRPPPPPAAMSVGLGGRSPSHAGPIGRGASTNVTGFRVGSAGRTASAPEGAAGPAASSGAVGGTDSVASDLASTPLPQTQPRSAASHLPPQGTPHTPVPTRIDDRRTAKTGAKTGEKGGGEGLSSSHPHRRRGSDARSEGGAEPPSSSSPPSAHEERAGGEANDRTGKRSGTFELPASASRRASSWVADAVAASAQRAGTTPPPPIAESAVPPPPVAAAAPIEEVGSAAAITADVDVPPRSSKRVLLIGSGVGLAAALIIGLSIRPCGGDGRTDSGRQATTATRENRTRSPAAAAPVVVPRSVAPVTGPALAPAPVVDASAETVEPAVAAPVPRSPDASALIAATPQSPDGGTAGSGRDSPTAGPGNESPTRVAATAPAAAEPAAPPPPGSGEPPLGSAGGGNDGEADGEPATNAAPGPKVAVLLSSTPVGAQVGTTRKSFGSTPVTVKLKVGRTYNLVFTRDGYRAVTKQFRVSKFADQQVVAVLRKDGAPEKAPPTPPVTRPEPAKPERNWFQRVFAR